MIPKQIFFIWFGDNKPNYVDFTIKVFKDVNPLYKIDLIWYKISDLNNTADEILKKCIDISYFKKSRDYEHWTVHSHKRFGYTLRFQEFYRFELLKKYGGIYIDCDTFPSKPFDDDLLNCDSFCCKTFWHEEFHKRRRDICFFGCKKDFNIKSYKSFEKETDIMDPFYNTNEKWLQLREKFYKCELKYGDSCNNKYYIDHYLSQTWIKENYKIEKCKYDK